MAISVVCGQCQHRMSVADEHAGKKVRCKGCGQPVRIPVLESLDDLPELPSPGQPVPPPLPASRAARPPALEDLEDEPASPAWLRDKRVLVGVGAGVVVLLLVIGLGMSGGSKPTEESGTSGGGSGSSSSVAQKDAGINGDKDGGKAQDPAAPPAVPEAGEAADVLPPPPPPFKHADLAQQAAKGEATQRNAALAKLGEVGEEARPAAHVLCEAILDRQTREAALLALEKVHPALYKPVLALVVDNNAWNHQQASQQIAALQRDGAPAVPVLVWHLTLAANVKDPKHPFYHSVESLVGEDLTALAAIAPRDPGVVKLLIEHTRFQRADGKPGATVRQKAIDGLGRIAFEFPEHRDPIVLVLIPALIDPDLQKNALAAAARCSTRSEPLKPVLQKLKLNPDAGVRQAADEALNEIELRVKYVPELNKVGIKEGLIPHALFEWAYSISSGKANTNTAVPSLTKTKDAELYLFYTCLCLNRLADSPARKQAPVRQFALEQVIQLGGKQEHFRKYLLPCLLRALDETETYALARDTLPQYGVEMVQALKAARNPGARKFYAELDSVLLARWQGLTPPAKMQLLVMLEQLEQVADTTRAFLVKVISESYSQPDQSKAAARCLAKFKVKELEQALALAQLIRQNYVREPEAREHLQEACAGLQVEIRTQLGLHASLLRHPQAPDKLRLTAMEWLRDHFKEVQAANDPALQTALRDALTAQALAQQDEDRMPWWRNVQFLVDSYGGDAKAVAPLLATVLEKYYYRHYDVSGDDRFHYALEALKLLERLLPEVGPEVKPALERFLALDWSAYRYYRGGSPNTNAVNARRQARKLLEQLTARGPELPPAPRPEGAVVLFDGKDLQAWAAFGKKSMATAWKVNPETMTLCSLALKDSNLHCDLLTKKAYRNYTMHLEFRFPQEIDEEGGGVKVAALDKADPHGRPVGIECNIAPNDTGHLYSTLGDLLGQVRGQERRNREFSPWLFAERKLGEWNQCDITVAGGRLVVRLNGQVVNAVRDVAAGQAGIALLGRGRPVEYRNIYLVPVNEEVTLPTPPAVPDAPRSRRGK